MSNIRHNAAAEFDRALVPHWDAATYSNPGYRGEAPARAIVERELCRLGSQRGRRPGHSRALTAQRSQ